MHSIAESCSSPTYKVFVSFLSEISLALSVCWLAASVSLSVSRSSSLCPPLFTSIYLCGAIFFLCNVHCYFHMYFFACPLIPSSLSSARFGHLTICCLYEFLLCFECAAVTYKSVCRLYDNITQMMMNKCTFRLVFLLLCVVLLCL